VSSRQADTIGLTALDSLLYGAAKAFSYLGDEGGQEMLDKAGEGIVEYLVSKGFVEKSDDFQKMTFGVVNFFQQNGYIGQMDVVPKGEGLTITMSNWRFLPLMKNLRSRGCYLLSCPMCLANDAVLRSSAIGWNRIHEEITGGVYSIEVRAVPVEQSTVVPSTLADMRSIVDLEGSERIGISAFEAVEYGLMRGFDYLGTQAELFLDAIGKGILEFLTEQTGYPHPDELERAIVSLANFFTKNNLADRIEVQYSQTEVKVDFENYRYAPVLRQALNEGLRTVSCPFLLTLKTILRRRGRTVAGSEWRFTNGRDASLLMRLRERTDEFDEEKTKALMD